MDEHTLTRLEASVEFCGKLPMNEMLQKTGLNKYTQPCEFHGSHSLVMSATDW